MYVLFFKFLKYNSARPFLCIRDYSLYALKLAIIALISVLSLFFISCTLTQSVFKSSEWGSFLGQGARPLNHPWLGFSPYSLVCPYGSTPGHVHLNIRCFSFLNGICLPAFGMSRTTILMVFFSQLFFFILLQAFGYHFGQNSFV